MSTLTHKHRRARKRHKCSGCLGWIEAGNIYLYHSYVHEHAIEVWKSCERCVPSEESCWGAWLRPEKVWAAPGEYPAHYEGGAVMIESYMQYEGDYAAEYAQHESVMLPLMGMMEWAEVRNE